MKIKDLVRRCNSFYKKANIETDMAKRIMFSIIPSLMTPTEKHSILVDPSYWALDLKALKSAVMGSKDLVKYGTFACAEELQFYLKYEVNYTFQVRGLAKSGQYIEALNLAEKIFLDLKNWAEGYGREPWARIARILKQIEEKRQFLDMVKEESKSQNKDSKTNYEQLEIETMKEIIVLMNVFDGLAHNSGNIIPKLMNEETRELSPETYDPHSSERVSRMMDAKELNNPIDVYREIQHVVDQPMYKSTFGDWISRIRQNPAYHAPQDPYARRNELKRINTKKILISFMPKLEQISDKLIEMKDKILNAPPGHVHDLKYTFKQKVAGLRPELSVIYSWCESAIYYSSKEGTEGITPYVQGVMDYVVRARQELLNIYQSFTSGSSSEIDTQEVISAAHKIKRLISGLEGVIASA